MYLLAQVVRNRPMPMDSGGAGLLGGVMGMVCLLFNFAILAVMLMAMWKVFVKAGQPGWASLIPIYNVYVLVVEILEQPILSLICLFVPVVNVVFWILICIELARAFGKDALFGIGLALLGPIFFPILGFGDARYYKDDREPSRGPKRKRRRKDDYEDEDEDDEDYEERPRRPRR